MKFDDLSIKQIVSYEESNSRINIWEGAVRSGKSFSCMLRFIKEVRYGPEGDMMICGKTEDTIRRNLIGPLQEILGEDIHYKIGSREIKLWGRKIFVVSANDERAEFKIRGSTLAGCLVDEITILPQSFFTMLLSRLSIPNSKLFGTTNPDSPFHWLKRDFLDRDDLDLKVFRFSMDDNPSLTQQYKDALAKEYTGLWRQRYIDGLWVLAEGTVFSLFDEEKHLIAYPPGAAEYHIVGVDYGTTNPTTFAMIGYNGMTFPQRWLEKEYYWDSRREMRQKTDAEYALDLKKFCEGYKVRAIYLDPSAVSFRVELQRLGFSILEADNEVLDGIRYHGMLLDNGTFKICKNCKKTVEEYGTYRWDTKAQMRGEDKPIKDNDHLMDAIRYALFTHFFQKEGKRMTATDLENLKSEVYGKAQLGKFFDDTPW